MILRFPFLRAQPSAVDEPSILLYSLWRSGTHWLAALLSDLTGLPSYYDSDDAGDYDRETLDQIRRYDRGRILIRHISLPPKEVISTAAERDVKTIFLYRDPRDAIASNVNMRKYCEGYRPGLPPFPDMSVSEILEWELDHLADVYRTLLAEWVAASNSMLSKVRYEDLRADTFGTLRAIVRFLDLDVRPGTIQHTVARHDFARTERRQPGVEKKDSHRRKGIVGDFRNQFDDAQQRRLTELLRAALVPMGYEP